MPTNPAVLKAAAWRIREHAKRVAEYEFECELDRRDGHRPHYCIHGTNQWTDYDNICWQCEEGIFTRYTSGVELRRQALDWADTHVTAINGKIAPLMAAAQALFGSAYSDDAQLLIRRWCDEMTREYTAIGAL